MKKIYKYLFLSGLSVLFLNSCASNKVTDNVEDSPENHFEAAEISDNSEESDTDNTSEPEENQDTESETPDEPEVSDSQNTDPEDFEEPLVLDFTPSEEEDVLLILDDIPSDTPIEEQIEDFDEPDPVPDDSFILQISSNSQNKDDSFIAAVNAEINKQAIINRIAGIDSNQIDTDTLTANNDITPLIEINHELSSDNADDYEEVFIPSRKITLNEGEYIDITYPGVEWKFYGLTDNSTDIEFIDLKQNSTNTKITLLAKAPGTKVLHFFKIDFLTEKYIDDFIEVEILPVEKKVAEPAHKEVPKYKQVKSGIEKVKKEKKTDDIETSENTEEISSSVKSTPKNTEEKKNVTDLENKLKDSKQKTTSTAVQTEKTSPVSESKVQKTNEEKSNKQEEIKQTINPEDILKEAKKLYNSKKYKDSLDKINEYLSVSSDKRDEALYLEGQLYETQSDIRNIKSAINAYNTLINNYPASKFWNDANKRIIYLKRFYMEGR